MSQQNIREYNYKKWFLRPAGQNLDVNLASDERDYNEEVVFSPNLIAQNDGNILPIYFDLNNSGSSQLFVLNYGIYNSANTLVSLNYYNPNEENLDMFTASTLCDIGLTAIDNGLVTEMSGETISFTMGLFTGASKFDRYSFDRRFKMFQVTGYTDLPNERFSGNTDRTVYEIVSKTNSQIGTYNQLYGGFYQGFFKLFGYDYETFPNRTNKGWSVEMVLKPRLAGEYGPNAGETTLNITYPENAGTFFYFGTRGENKFYHHASGSPASDTGYTRVTQTLEGILKTCACDNTGVTNSRCIEVYNPIEYTVEHNIDCNCGCPNNSVMNPDKDPLYDSMSNAFSLRLEGDPSNPKVCVKVLKFTGDCVVTGTTPTTGITYQTGYTVTEYCSESNIYDYCDVNGPDFLTEEHWFLVDAVWERNTYFDTCDLYYRGGLGLITDLKYVDSLSNNTVRLIEPPVTHTGSPAPDQVEIVNLNERWLIEKSDRLGALKIYVNGKLFYVINGFEEIIPRGLNAEKEKQLGVPFNISWGGGTQGLRESLTFDPKPACDIAYGVEIGLDLLVIVTPGSIQIEYVLTTEFQINEDITVDFTHVLGTNTGNDILISSSVTIPSRGISGNTFVTLDEDFSILNQTSSFENVVTLPEFLSGNIDLTFESEFIVPTPTPTETITPTPTPSITQTITPSITSTITPSVTSSQTPTPSITPTTSPIPEQVITDAIITDNVEYINVGDNLYLKFIDPQILEDPIITDDNKYIIVGGDLYLKFVDPINVDDAILTDNNEYIIVGDSLYLKYINPSPVPQTSPTPTVTPTITPSPSQQPLYPLTLNVQSMSGGQAIIFDGITYTANTTVNILLETLYIIEGVPLPGYTLGGWGAAGATLDFLSGESWTVLINSTGGASVTPNYEEIPTPTPTNTETPTPTPTPTIPIPIICDTFTLTGNNVTTTVNSAIKTSNGGWDGSAYSVESYTSPVSVSFQVSSSNLYLMGGFSYNPNANPNDTYVDISYGLYVQPNFLEIYENGTQVTVLGEMTNTTSDLWKVDYNGTDVKYYKNGGLIYTSSNAVIQPLYVYFPLLTFNEGVTNVCVIESPSPTPTPTTTPTTTMTPTPSFTPNCVRQIVVPTLWNGVTSSNSNTLQLTQTSETLQIQVNDIITDNIGATSFVGVVSSDGTYTYV